jgi:hypothetical protein
MHPPGQEKATRQGGSLKTDVAETLPLSTVKVNGIAAPPDGCGYYFDKDGKRHFEPCELHPSLVPEDFTPEEKNALT